MQVLSVPVTLFVPKNRLLARFFLQDQRLLRRKRCWKQRLQSVGRVAGLTEGRTCSSIENWPTVLLPNFCSAKESVMAALYLQHPISYNQCDICSMVKDKTLGKLEHGVFKLMCKDLNISLPPDQKEKPPPPYISLLVYLVKTCPCSIN